MHHTARTNMMMRFAKVSPQGDYVPPPPANSKASYATMLFVRADIVKNSGALCGVQRVLCWSRAAAERRHQNSVAPRTHHAL
jgi:acyl-CoA oxidase